MNDRLGASKITPIWWQADFVGGWSLHQGPLVYPWPNSFVQKFWGLQSWGSYSGSSVHRDIIMSSVWNMLDLWICFWSFCGYSLKSVQTSKFEVQNNFYHILVTFT